jgi:hypothetical protein
MAKTLMVKTIGGKLEPRFDDGREALMRIKAGAELMVEFKQPRSIQHHRWFFALVNLVHANDPQSRTVEDLRSQITVAAGHYSHGILPDGTVVAVPKSIAFHKMDQAEFAAFADSAVRAVVQHFLPGVTEQGLRNEIAEMIGIGWAV